MSERNRDTTPNGSGAIGLQVTAAGLISKGFSVTPVYARSAIAPFPPRAIQMPGNAAGSYTAAASDTVEPIFTDDTRDTALVFAHVETTPGGCAATGTGQWALTLKNPSGVVVATAANNSQNYGAGLLPVLIPGVTAIGEVAKTDLPTGSYQMDFTRTGGTGTFTSSTFVALGFALIFG